MQFQGYIDEDVEADGLEELYAEAHKQIREDPFKAQPKSDKPKSFWIEESKKYKQKKLSKAEKEERVKAKIAELKGN